MAGTCPVYDGMTPKKLLEILVLLCRTRHARETILRSGFINISFSCKAEHYLSSAVIVFGVSLHICNTLLVTSRRRCLLAVCIVVECFLSVGQRKC